MQITTHYIQHQPTVSRVLEPEDLLDPEELLDEVPALDGTPDSDHEDEEKEVKEEPVPHSYRPAQGDTVLEFVFFL